MLTIVDLDVYFMIKKSNYMFKYIISELKYFGFFQNISEIFYNKSKVMPFIKVCPAIFFMGAPGNAQAQVLDLQTFSSFAQRCGSKVATLTLAAIAKTESRFQTLVVADNSTGISRTYQTIDEAASSASSLISRGHSVDMGLMQINSANLRRLGMSVRDVLEPCQAIRAAATILTGNFLAMRRVPDKQVALRNAISMYNTGNATRGYKNGYVRKVENAANSLAEYFFSNKTISNTDYMVSEKSNYNNIVQVNWDVMGDYISGKTNRQYYVM